MGSRAPKRTSQGGSTWGKKKKGREGTLNGNLRGGAEPPREEKCFLQGIWGKKVAPKRHGVPFEVAPGGGQGSDGTSFKKKKGTLKRDHLGKKASGGKKAQGFFTGKKKKRRLKP